jgi:hypothetical protein
VSVASIKRGKAHAKCVMCGKEAIISDEHDNDKNKKKRQQPQQVQSSMLVEQIDGKCYTFHTADCALIFKKLSTVYGSNFADE